MLYRILDNLEWGSGRKLAVGSIDALKGVPSKVRAMLEEKGAISQVQSPPLAIIPGWERRADALQTAGIEDVNDLLDADLGGLSEELDTPVEELEQSVQDALQYVT